MLAHHLARQTRVPVGHVAAGEEALPAEEALAARDGERHDDPVADLEPLHLGADLDDLAHRLVPEDLSLLHERAEVAIVEVQVRAADGSARDLDDQVLRVFELGLGNVLDPDVLRPMPHDRSHRGSWWLVLEPTVLLV